MSWWNQWKRFESIDPVHIKYLDMTDYSYRFECTEHKNGRDVTELVNLRAYDDCTGVYWHRFECEFLDHRPSITTMIRLIPHNDYLKGILLGNNTALTLRKKGLK